VIWCLCPSVGSVVDSVGQTVAAWLSVPDRAPAQTFLRIIMIIIIKINDKKFSLCSILLCIFSLYCCVCVRRRRGLLLANRIAAWGKCHCRRRQKGRTGEGGGGGRVWGEGREKCLYTIYIRARREAPPGVSSYAKRIYAFIIRFIMRICPENVYNIFAARINRIFLGVRSRRPHSLSGGLFFSTPGLATVPLTRVYNI